MTESEIPYPSRPPLDITPTADGSGGLEITTPEKILRVADEVNFVVHASGNTSNAAEQAIIERNAGDVAPPVAYVESAFPSQRASRPLLKADESLLIAHDPYHPHSEKLRVLRTELLLRHEQRGRANIVAVLSPCPGEGRSQLAAELAIAFAQLGQPTLLVDADLRKPRQHILFGADNRLGLSQALSAESYQDVANVEGLPQLFVLPAGPLPRNPLELLSAARFEHMINEWRDRYSYVVIDTPPVSQYSDGLAVATLVGRVLALARAHHTPHRETREMLRRLTATHSRILGAVISQF